jgi:hypothetical protein
VTILNRWVYIDEQRREHKVREGHDVVDVDRRHLRDGKWSLAVLSIQFDDDETRRIFSNCVRLR